MIKELLKRVIPGDVIIAMKNNYIGKQYRHKYRKKFALSYYSPKINQIKEWVKQSNEDSNFTYDLTDDNIDYLAHTISVVTGEKHDVVINYIDELRNNDELKHRISELISRSDFKDVTDNIVHFGRRLGWYAFARVLKPKIIIETGVDKGLGSVCLCEALKQNTREGFPGYYYGTDINPAAGYLFHSELKKYGEILYGDSITSLNSLDMKVDLFINDSDHSSSYEFKEYQAIKDKLSDKSIILGDNSHGSISLAKYSHENNRKFLFFKEVPKNHWYPGAGIGISFQ